jgi:hypothetical protein
MEKNGTSKKLMGINGIGISIPLVFYKVQYINKIHFLIGSVVVIPEPKYSKNT